MDSTADEKLIDKAPKIDRLHLLRFSVICFLICFATSFQIYQSAVTNNLYDVALPWLEKQFNNNTQAIVWHWSILTGAAPLGNLVGTMVSGVMADNLGRIPTLHISGVVLLVGGIMTTIFRLVNNFTVAIVGRVLIAVSIGIGVNAMIFYLVEISPTAYRGRVNSLIPLSFGIGNLCALLVTLPQALATPDLWHVALAIGCVPGLLLSVLLLFLPESPRFLLIQKTGQVERGIRAIEFYQGSEMVSETLREIEAEKADLITSKKVTLLSILKDADHRRSLFLSIYLNSIMELTGVIVLLSYSTLILQSAGMEHTLAAYCSLAAGVCKFLSGFPATALTDSWGRKPQVIFGSAVTFISLLFMMIPLGVDIGDLNVRPLLVAIGLNLWMCGFSFSNNGAQVMMSEVFMQSTRATGLVITGVWGWFIFALIAATYLPFLKAVGPAWSLMPFCVWSILVCIISVFILPETANRTFLDIVKNH